MFIHCEEIEAMQQQETGKREREKGDFGHTHSASIMPDNTVSEVDEDVRLVCTRQIVATVWHGAYCSERSLVEGERARVVYRCTVLLNCNHMDATAAY